MPRRSDRSRAALVTAAGQVIRAKGLHRTRIREIAQAAQLSPAAVVYHYPENDDLILEVHATAVRDYLTGRRAAREQHDDPARALVAMVRAGVPPYADEDVIRLLFELQGLAARDDRHAELMTTLWREERGLYQEVVDAGIAAGVFRPTTDSGDVAAAILAAEDGMALHLVSNNRDLTGDRAAALVLQVAASVLDCPRLLSA